MPISNPTRLVTEAFGNAAPSGNVNAIPDADQTGTNPRGASFETGFPTSTLTPSASGGLPPDGADMNGILNIVTDHVRFQNSGGVYKFDAGVATAIGGYDKGTVLLNNAGTGSYISAVDNNTINFNTTPASIGVQWMPYAGGAIAVGAPTYTEDEKWELCPIGHCQPFIEGVMGETLNSWLSTHPHWDVLHNVSYLDNAHTQPGTVLQGRAMAAYANPSHPPYSVAGSDNSTLIAHTHAASDVSHSHTYRDRYNRENKPYLLSRDVPSNLIENASSGWGQGGPIDNDNNGFLYIDSTTGSANLTINVSTAGSGNGTNANIQRTVYLPWIIKVA